LLAELDKLEEKKKALKKDINAKKAQTDGLLNKVKTVAKVSTYLKRIYD
jgi:hypothetical protein